ncbi:MAG: translation initiation factor IF-2 [Patescibacteria group bacterium]|nr:translation initiation factor IF-2 [Patescibacteria group bacterium]
MSENNSKQKRPPIVVVVGHVDHGKTTLLDYIRKSNVAAKEAGGITQSVGAYEIEHNKQRITFIDTPGHEAFSKMRVRGAALADIAILVVAADEGVKPQTKESIKVLQETKTPFVVAITKIDKSAADINKVKSDLAANNVLLEGFGGNVSFQGVSGKTGQGVDDILDLILLAAEMEELTYDPNANARGIVLESRKDKQRGFTTSVILKDGKLRTGDIIATKTSKGKIKILENFLGKKVDSLDPSSPAVIIGFETLPKTGEEFIAGKLSEEEIKKITVKNTCPEARSQFCKLEGDCVVRVILKADVSGSLEALSELVKKIPMKDKYALEIVGEGVGEIGDNDIKNAIAMKAIILGFRVRSNKAAENMAKDNKIEIITSEIIYELVEAIQSYFTCLSSGDISGDLEVLAVFGKKSGKQIVGGRVVSGEIKNNVALDIQYKGEKIGTGKIINLQEAKRDVMSVSAGKECGLLITSEVEIKPDHHLILR